MMDRIDQLSDDLIRRVALEVRYKLKERDVTCEEFEALALSWLGFRDYFMVSKYFASQLNETLSEKDARGLIQQHRMRGTGYTQTKSIESTLHQTYLDQLIGSPTTEVRPGRRVSSILKRNISRGDDAEYVGSDPTKMVKNKRDDFLSAQLMQSYNQFQTNIQKSDFQQKFANNEVSRYWQAINNQHKDMRGLSSIDLEKVIEDELMLKTLLENDKIYDNFMNLTKERAALQEIEEHALALSKKIKNKAEAAWSKTRQGIDRNRNLRNQYMFTGDKKEMLVRKFIQNLLQSVQERRDQELRQSSTKFVRNLVDQMNHSNQVKHTQAMFKQPLDAKPSPDKRDKQIKQFQNMRRSFVRNQIAKDPTGTKDKQAGTMQVAGHESSSDSDD